MQRNLRVYLTVIGAAVGLSASLLLAACGGHQAVPPTTGANNLASSHAGGLPGLMAASCYTGDSGTTKTVSDTVTFYGWPDNSPPGAAIAHPVIHSVAGGDGSYCNPTTFATEPTSAENSLFPYGSVIYVPLVKKYFIREDDCTNSGPSVGSGSNGCSGIWTDLWLGGDSSSNTNSVVNCEQNLTPSAKQSIIVHPPSTEEVDWTGPIYSDSKGCNAGGTAVTPTPKPTATPTVKPTATPTVKPTATPTVKPTATPTVNPTATPTTQPTATPTPGGGGISSTLEFYDYFDNGNSCAIAHPVIHSCAGGTGTWSNPITFAASTSNNTLMPYGSKIYVPSLKRYFIREDDCASGDCSGYAVNLWVGGNSSDVSSDVAACESWLTPSGPQTVIYNPPSNEPVTSGSLWNESNGECDGSYNYSN